MARRLVSLAAAAMGVLMLSHQADAFHNIDILISNHELKPRGSQSVQVSATSSLQEAFYDQAVLDHNAPVEQTFWKQRYFINTQFWGGKGLPSSFTMLAIKHRVLLVGLEHRYYGKSVPTADLSVENLKFVSSAQQMADMVRSHGFLTTTLGLETSKWIAFGGSYGGSLAAWEKLKYPSLFAGAVSSSGPLDAKTNFFEYNEVVGRSLRYFGGDECYNRVEQGVVAFRRLLDGGRVTQSQSQKLFPACNPIQNDLDLSIYESAIPSPFMNATRTALGVHAPQMAVLKSITEKAKGLEMCKRVFNLDPVPSVTSTNLQYGGLNVTVENVTFVSGSLDPWIAISVTNETHLNAASSSAVYIDSTSHCVDMFASRETDLPALTAAYAKIAANVATYLGA